MPDSDDFEMPEAQEKVNELLVKILAYQSSLPDGRAVELDELQREGVLTPTELEFLTSQSVTYKPHRLSDYHALDMFQMTNADGGQVFIGPCGPPLSQRRASLRTFQPIVESFLQLPRPTDELLLYLEFTENDGMAVSPDMITFGFQSNCWRVRLPAIRAVAAEFGFSTLQDEVVQGSHRLTYAICLDAVGAAAATSALLARGCGFADETEIVYSAGALDEGCQRGSDDSGV